MKRWFPSLAAVTVGIGIGCGIGYAVALMSAADKNVLIIPPTGNSFQRVFMNMGKLYAFETLASNCKGTSDIPFVLRNEADLIQKLREAANGSGLTPALDVAESRLAVRNAIMAEGAKDPKLQSEQAARAQKLLESNGWREPSASRMGQVIVALDHEECWQTPTTTEPTR
jgi:hypothetical protein